MKPQTKSRFAQALLNESRQAIGYGAYYSQFTFIAAIVIVSVLALFVAVPFGFIMRLVGFMAFMTLAVHITFRIARAGAAVHIHFLYGSLLAIVCAPSLFVVAMELLEPGAGAMFYISPVMWAHFPLLVLTGLLFNLRFSVLAGASAALLHFLAFWLAWPEILNIHHDDPALIRILHALPGNIMRSVLLLFTGFLTGLVSRYARDLLLRIVDEQEEKERINDLFGEYVSEEVRERILEKTRGMTGERTRTVVLFSDIRGFTSLSERLPPEQLVGQLNEYLDAMVEVIGRRRGVVDKFIGDAIMATFGGVVELAAPCDQALAAAVEMRDRLGHLNASFRERGLPELKIGIGMHYAEVLQGIVGSSSRKEYTVIGDGVNIAARLESATKKLGQVILFSGEFEAGLSPGAPSRAVVRQLGKLRLRGREEATRLFTVDPEFQDG